MATPDWTVLEKLLLAQAVYKYGEDNWFQIARTLRHHPMVHRQPEFYNQKNCSLQYYLLIEGLEAQKRHPKVGGLPTPQDMPDVVKIARQLYTQRMEELRRLIKEDEDRFTHLVTEIDEIRAGKWDSKLTDVLKKDKTTSTASSPSAERTESTLATKTGVETPKNMDTVTATPETQETSASPSREESTPGAEPSADTTVEKGIAVGVQSTPESHFVKEEDAPMSLAAVRALSDTGSAASRLRIEPATAASVAVTGYPSPDVTPRKVDSSQPTPLSAAFETQPLATQSTPAGRPEGDASDGDYKRSIAPDESDHTSEASRKRPRLDDQAESESVPRLTPQIIESASAQEAEQAHKNAVGEEPSEPETFKVKMEQDELMPGTQELPTHTTEPKADITMEREPETTPSETSHPSPSPTPMESKVDMGTSEGQVTPDIMESTDRYETESPITNTHSTNSPGPHDRDGTESITGSESNAPTPSATSERKRMSKDDQRQKSWQKNINLLWREIANHKNGAMYMNPIKEATAPLYYDIVKHPVDLKTIKNRIRDGVIKTTAEFERDIILMLTNSIMYNREGTEMYQMAMEMLEDVMEQLRVFKTADANSSASSHTRSALAHATSSELRAKSETD